jgi:hypothetical protein
MAVRTDPRFGYKYGWASGDDGWGSDMNTNLELLMWLATHPRVLDRDLTAPPGSPSIGDAYIPAATASGDWAGHEGDLAIWWQNPTDASAEWKFVSMTTGTEGVIVHVTDEDVLAVWGGDSWGSGINIDQDWENLLSRLSVLDRDLTAPPGSPSIGDAYIPAATASGDWAGHEDDVAVWWQGPSESSASWHFFTPADGHRAHVVDEDRIVIWDGNQWFDGIPMDMPMELKLSRLSVADRDLTAPPGSPSIGDTYIPAATATGAWAGHEDDVAIWWLAPGDSAAAWYFHTPETGLRAYIVDEDVLSLWDGANWTPGLTV